MIGTGSGGAVIQADIAPAAAAHAVWLSSGGASGTRADFTGNDLTGLDLSNLNWSNSVFTSADCSTTLFVSANLTGAVLTSTRMNWNAHDLLHEVLRQAYPADPYMAPYVAAITANRRFCWDHFAVQFPRWARAGALAAYRAKVVVAADSTFLDNVQAMCVSQGLL